MTPESVEETGSFNERPQKAPPNKNGQKNLVWLFPSLMERKKEPDWKWDENTENRRLQIGSHYYWIRMVENNPELCRMAVRKDSLILHEVLENDNLGITNDDLEDAVRQDHGELMVSPEYRISNHIKRKLQILYAP
jgi:hypothetical protein